MSTAKQKPHELGCTRPYTLSAKGKLLSAEGERAEMHAFITAYRQSGQRLLELFLGWWRAGGDSQIVAVLLILPARIEPRIEESDLWRNVHAEAEKVVAAGWPTLVGQRLYHFLRTMAGVEGRAANGPEMMAGLLARLELPPLGMDAHKFAYIFEAFPSEKLRAKLTIQIAGVLRGFFSQAENARHSNDDKSRVLTRFRETHRDFFDGLQRLIRSQAAWQRSCQSLGPVRRRLIREASIPAAVVNACQVQAIRERGDLTSWQAVLDEHTPASLEGLAKHAAENRPVAMELLRALPAAELPDGIEEGAIRHFTSARRVRELARAPYFAQRLLELYDRHVERFPASQRELIDRVEKFGRKTIHTGWRELLEAPKTPAITSARRFFLREVMAFCTASRRIRTPTLVPENALIWPMFEERKQWRSVTKHPSGVGNTLQIDLRLPAFLDRPERWVSTVLRSHIPFARAQPLREPVNVLDGPFQFRPNETLKIDGDPTRKSYIKAQGLWLSRPASG